MLKQWVATPFVPDWSTFWCDRGSRCIGEGAWEEWSKCPWGLGGQWALATPQSHVCSTTMTVCFIVLNDTLYKTFSSRNLVLKVTGCWVQVWCHPCWLCVNDHHWAWHGMQNPEPSPFRSNVSCYDTIVTWMDNGRIMCWVSICPNSDWQSCISPFLSIFSCI